MAKGRHSKPSRRARLAKPRRGKPTETGARVRSGLGAFARDTAATPSHRKGTSRKAAKSLPRKDGSTAPAKGRTRRARSALPHNFGFLLHPMSIEDVAKKYKIATKVSPKVVEGALKRRRPFVISKITGIRSKAGVRAPGSFGIVPLLPDQFLKLEEDFVVDKIVKACKACAKEGARIVGLGAFTAVAGDGGRKVAERAGVAVTTGNTYTVAVALEATRNAAEVMGIDIGGATVAIVGATGSIGSLCARVLAPDAGRMILLGRDEERLGQIEDQVRLLARGDVLAGTDIRAGVGQADVVVTVTGASGAIIEPEDIKPGAVVCDVARPRDVSAKVAGARDDVLVIDGGIVEVPGNMRSKVDLGLPDGMALACMAETMILALEGRYENYTLGKDIPIERLHEMQELAAHHGFRMAAFRSFDQVLGPARIEQIKANAARAPVTA